MLHNAKEPFRICARSETFHFTLDRQRQYIFFPQRQRPQNNHGQRNDRARQQRPHENAALGKKPGDSLEDVEHRCDLNGHHRLLNVVNDSSDSRPSGGNAFATSSGIGGNCASRIDCRHTLAKASLESLLITLRFFTRPLRSTAKLTRVVPSFTRSAFSST